MGQTSSVDLELASFCEVEHNRLVGLLALYVGERPVAEELAQDAFARVCEHWPRVRVMGNPRAWLNRVALNLAKSWFRRKAAERRAYRRHESGDDPHPTDRASVLAVRQAVSQLPERQRLALVAVAALVAIPWPGGNVTVDDGFAGSGNEAPAGQEDEATSDEQSAASGWDELSMAEAADKLIALGAQHDTPAAEPPPPGKLLRLHEVYVTQERLHDGTARWELVETRSDIADEQDFTIVSARAETELPADAGRDEAIRFVADQRPAQLEPSDAAGMGYDFHDDGWRARVRQTIEEYLAEGRMDAEATHAAAFDAGMRTWILEQFVAHPDAVTYEGVVSDVLGRDAVAFSAPSVAHESFETGTARVLFDPETGQPSGWEYGGGDLEWRIHATVAHELVDAG